MDVHVPMAITLALRSRGVMVRTAQEDGSDRLPDPDLLDRTTSLGYVLFTRDADLLAEAARRQASGVTFAGVVFAHQLRVTIRRCIDDLELVGKVYDPADMINRVEYLPL
jgi:hypothetical protein